MKRNRVEFENEIVFDLPPEEPASKKMAGMKPFHPDLPQIPFFVGIIGPRHSGKSVFLYNLLSNRTGMYGASFKKNNIIVYSMTKDKDPTLKHLKLKNMYGPPTSVAWLVQDIQTKQKAYLEAENMTGVLIVFDDATQLKEAWPSIEYLSYTGRHDHIHAMYVAHKMSSIPRGVRTQTQQWVIFKPHEESEWQWILDMFAKNATKAVWQNALARAWAKKHNFVLIDYEEKELDRIFRNGFHEPLFTSEEMMLVSGQIPLSSREMGMLEQLKAENGNPEQQTDEQHQDAAGQPGGEDEPSSEEESADSIRSLPSEKEYSSTDEEDRPLDGGDSSSEEDSRQGRARKRRRKE